MIFDGKPIHEITDDEIDALVQNHIGERQHLEFKVTVNTKDDKDRLELLRDVASWVFLHNAAKRCTSRLSERKLAGMPNPYGHAIGQHCWCILPSSRRPVSIGIPYLTPTNC